MPLIILVESTDPAQAVASRRRVEVSDRLTIGRGLDRDLVLADPSISKQHCVIEYNGHGYTVTDTSTNGTFLNSLSERLPKLTAVPLPERSVLLFGSYRLTATAVTPSDCPSIGAPTSGDQAQSAAPPDDPLFGDPLAGQDVLGRGPPDCPAARKTDDAFDFGSSPKAEQRDNIPEDADLFGDETPEPQWYGGSQHDHTPSDQMHFTPPKIIREKIPDNWDPAEDGIPMAPKPAPLRNPEPASARPKQSPRPATAKASAQAAREIANEDGAALAIFLAAVGLANVALSGPEKRKLMQETGQILDATVKGLLELLSARAAAKEEFRLEKTRLGATGNNPLKFSVSSAEAIRLLLIDRSPGFLPARQSIEEVLGDLKMHEVGLMAGMQAVLATVVARFDPAIVEKRFEQNSLLEEILPAARKARYWEAFKTCYKEIVSELQEDFHKDLGEKFTRAYKQQVEQS